MTILGLPDLPWLAATVELRRSDLASGMVPHDVTRPLFPHEVAAGTDFAGIEAGVDTTAGQVAKHLETDRAAFIALLDADLAAVAANPGVLPNDVAVAQRLLQLDNLAGISSIAGVGALIDEAETRYRDILAQAAMEGGVRVHQEAANQGVDVTAARVKLGGLDEYRLDLVAQRLAQAPHADVLAAAGNSAYRIPDPSAVGLRDQVIADLRQLSPQPLLTTMARPAVQIADGIGRVAAATGLPQPSAVYASELLDKATCGPCEQIDGKHYPSLAAAKVDYPAGGFKDCAGGDRCRGTLVTVWDEVPPGG
jgi:hypothetical protein